MEKIQDSESAKIHEADVELLTLAEAAALTRLSESHIKKLKRAGMFVPEVDMGINKGFHLKSDVVLWMQNKIDSARGAR